MGDSMGKGTKKKKNNSNKNTIKNAQMKTTKNVASETTSEKEFENAVLEEIEIEETDLNEEVKEDFVEAEYEEVEEDFDDEVEIEDDDFEEEIEDEEDNHEEVEEYDEKLEDAEFNEENDYEDDNEEIEYEEDNHEENIEEKVVVDETIDYNEVIKKVTKKADYKIKNEKIKTKKEKKKLSLNFKDNEIGNLIKIILIITGVVLVLYLVTLVYLKKDEVKEEENEISATIQYEEILGSKVLSQSPKEYYVLAYKEEDLYLTTYNIYIGNYQYKENAKKVYRMNLDLGFNEAYIGEKSNLKGSKVEELKFADTTLIKVKKKKVVEVYEGKEKILEHLRSITK